MGLANSSLVKRSDDEEALLAELGRAAGSQSLPPNAPDGFSASLHGVLSTELFFPAPPQSHLRDRLGPLCSHLGTLPPHSQTPLANDASTQNLKKVVMHCVWLLEHFPKPDADGALEAQHIHETVNALTLLRVFTVVTIEAKGHPLRHLDAPETICVKAAVPVPYGTGTSPPAPAPAQQPEGPLFARLVRSLAAFLCARDYSADARLAVELGAHAEAARVLLALLAVQMCDSCTPGEPRRDVATAAVWAALAGPSATDSRGPLAGPLVLALLRNYAWAPSSCALNAEQPQPQRQSLLAALLRLPTSFYSFLSAFLYGGGPSSAPAGAAQTAGAASPPRDPVAGTMEDAHLQLRSASLHLLLVLVHPAASMSEEEGRNPFRAALNALKDDHFATGSGAGAGIDFTKLYDAITRENELGDPVVLLLYFLLQGNDSFHRYVLARTDSETLMLPMLQVLYESVDTVEDWSSQQAIYMLVIILLMLSRDASFSRNLHFVRVRGVWWYKEHYLMETTLGGLLILVLVRVVQTNLRRLRDPYLHSNCLAVLANSSAYLTDLPAFASMRLVKLVETILSKCGLLRRQHQEQQQQQQQPLESQSPMDSGDTSYVGFLQAVLRIIGTALSFGLEKNPHLVYALLQQKAVLAPLATQPAFADHAVAILQVVDWFEGEMGKTDAGQQMTAEQIEELIRSRALACKAALKLRAEVAEYKYEEEAGAHEFFSPYVWSLVYHAPGMHCFSAQAVSLFAIPPTSTPAAIEAAAAAAAAASAATASAAQDAAAGAQQAAREGQQEAQDKRKPPDAQV
eukprot:m51a1_g4946 putative dymeclin (800) ;mRNA; f:321559-324441